ncbi:MAG: FliO/MopB family protein [Nocardioides sp.]
MLELVLRLAVSLGVVLGLFWLVARASARKLGGTRGVLRVHGRQSLSRTASLAVVEVGSRVLVVGVSEGGVRLLTELDPLDVVSPESEETDEDAAAGPRRTAGRRVAGRRAARPAALSGSLLSPQTWSQAWAAATAKSSAAPVVDGPTHE